MNTKSVAILLATALSTAMNAAPAAADSDMGRQLTAQYCTNPMAMPKPGACIALTDGVQTAHGYTDSPDRTLRTRPGTYWLTVTDNSPFHNFSLAGPDGSDTDLTGITDTPGAVTVKVNLTEGHWVLFCEPHRAMGMYVDILVGGVGQAARS
jgi:plastocyanin